MKYISKKYNVGSNYFFSKIDEFHSKDEDYLIFVDKDETLFEYQFWFKHPHEDKFIWKKLSPEDYIYYLNNVSILPMEAGAFLNNDICEFVGFTIEHLKQLKSVFDKIDDKHKYEQIIFDSYIENNGFFLTHEQLKRSYEEYKKYR